MSKNVKVYSTDTCPYCSMVKDFLKKNNVPFEEVNVASSPAKAKEMMDLTGQLGVPVVIIDGKVIIGFDKEGISRELGL